MPKTNMPKGKTKGVYHSQTTFLGLSKHWFESHKSLSLDSLLRLLQTPLQSLLTWLVIAIALALPTALFLSLENIQKLGQGWRDNAQISVFLQRQAQPAAITALFSTLLGYDEIESATLIDAEQALTEFQQYSGLGDVLNILDENPLPAVIVLYPQTSIDNPEKLSVLQRRIAQEPLVDHVQLDMGWLRRLHEIVDLARRIVFSLACLLGIGVLLIVGNTIRLAIESRREEIVIVKLVGGTNAFVRRPFLYTGWWYGIGGGILAIVLLAIVSYWLSGPVSRLASLYQSSYQLSGLDAELIIGVVLGAGILGWLGAWVAVSRHLYSIEPS